MPSAIDAEKAFNARRRTKVDSDAWRKVMGDPPPSNGDPAPQTVEVEWWPPTRAAALVMTIKEAGHVRLSTGLRRLLGPTVRIGGVATGEVVIEACPTDSPQARTMNKAGDLAGGKVLPLFGHGFSAGRYKVQLVDYRAKRVLLRRTDRIPAKDGSER